MSKSILVIDTPRACIDCPCQETTKTLLGEVGYSCQINGFGMITNRIKPDWCPLRDLPEKYEPVSMNFERGFNTCIDEILNENKF